MKRENYKNVNFHRTESSGINEIKEEFIPRESLYSIDELLEYFFIPPSSINGSSIAFKRLDHEFYILTPPKNVFSFRNPRTGEVFLTDYLWRDIISEEDL